MTPLQRIRLEKAAADCGFELSPELIDDRLVLRSAQFPESLIVHSLGNDEFAIEASTPMMVPVPVEPGSTPTIRGWNALYDLLEKAAATARTMPNRVAQKFHEVTAAMPRSTEAERMLVQRVGQNLFRDAVLDYWRARCCVTGLDVPELLRASHIKPWAQCESDEERLDVFNGLLLAPHLDALFDCGLMTVQRNDKVRFSSKLPRSALQQLGVQEILAVAGMTEAHQRYLDFHRSVVFKD